MKTDEDETLPEGTKVRFFGNVSGTGTIRGVSAKFPYVVLYIVQLDELLPTSPYSCVVMPCGSLAVLDPDDSVGASE
jgi:hypothetical protein